jgi:hypothetical protein
MEHSLEDEGTDSEPDDRESGRLTAPRIQPLVAIEPRFCNSRLVRNLTSTIQALSRTWRRSVTLIHIGILVAAAHSAPNLSKHLVVRTTVYIWGGRGSSRRRRRTWRAYGQSTACPQVLARCWSDGDCSRK